VASHLLNLPPARKEDADRDGDQQDSWGFGGDVRGRLSLVAIFRGKDV